MDDLPLTVRQHPQNGTGQRGFTGAGLPHQPQYLAPVQVKAHVVEHLLPSPAQHAGGPIPHIQVPHLQNGFAVHSFLLVGMAAMSRWV